MDVYGPYPLKQYPGGAISARERWTGRGSATSCGDDQAIGQSTVAGPGEVRVRPYEQHRRDKLVPVRGICSPPRALAT